MAADITLAQAMFRQQVEPTIQDQIVLDVILEDIIPMDGQNPEGITVDMKNNKFEIVSKTSGMTAYAGGEGSTIIHSDAGLDKMFTTPKFVTAAFKIGHEVMAATLKDQAALERMVDVYSLEIRQAMMRAKARHIRGDGSGIIGVLDAGVQTGTTINVAAKAPGTIVSGAKFALGTQWMDASQKIELGTAADFAAGTTIKATITNVNSDTQITAVDSTTGGSITVGASAGANNRGGTNATTWYIRLKGTYNNTPMGLLGLIDDGTISGVTTLQDKVRATTPYMKSFTLIRANKNTIVKDIRSVYTGARRSNNTHSYFLFSQDVYDAYTDAITITNQSNPGNAQYKTKLGTGHTGLAFAYGSDPLPIYLDTLLPAGTVLLVDPKFLFCADLFADDFLPDGLLARIPETRVYETVRAAYYNFGTYSSRKLGAQLHYES